MDHPVAVLTGLVIFSVFLTASANVLSLGFMIGCVVHLESPFAAYQRYDGYGCYCGFGGSGIPVDEVDCCCQAHDKCYDQLSSEGACQNIIGTAYKFTRRRCQTGEGSITCEHLDRTQSEVDGCAYALCNCDRDLSLCFARNNNHFTSSHHQYDRQRCGSGNGMASFCNP